MPAQTFCDDFQYPFLKSDFRFCYRKQHGGLVGHYVMIVGLCLFTVIRVQRWPSISSIRNSVMQCLHSLPLIGFSPDFLYIHSGKLAQQFPHI